MPIVQFHGERAQRRRTKLDRYAPFISTHSYILTRSFSCLKHMPSFMRKWLANGSILLHRLHNIDRTCRIPRNHFQVQRSSLILVRLIFLRLTSPLTTTVPQMATPQPFRVPPCDLYTQDLLYFLSRWHEPEIPTFEWMN